MRSGLIYFFGALGGFLFGYSTGIISGALHYIGNDLAIVENSFQEGVITSAILVGAIFGSVIIGKLSDSLGRRKSLFIGSLIFIVGSIASALSPSVPVLVLSRIILGFAVGAISALVPLYLSELAPAKKRGTIAFLNQIMIVLGILGAYIVNYLLATLGSDDWNTATGWRVSFAIAIVPAVLLFFGIFILPESPRFLIRTGNESKANDVLLKLNVSSSDVSKELEDIKSSISVRTSSFKEVFSKFARPALVIGVGLAFFQQVIGVNSIIYYGPKLLEVSGLDNQDQRLSIVLIGVVNVIATIVAISIVDRINRKTLFTVGGIVMALCLFALAIFGNLVYAESNPTVSVVVVPIILMIYIFAFGVTWGGAMWVVLGEIFPLHIRGAGIGIASGVNWVLNFAITLLFPFLLGHGLDANECIKEEPPSLVAACEKVTMLGGNPFWLFIAMGAFAVLGVLFVQFKLFETRGKSLEDIESEIYRRRSK
ncbi:putative metabolite transport protein YwtG [Actinomycetota bacterium]|nr:putative metabolite transport protein YwtG [Actinomycetota bacterium]